MMARGAHTNRIGGADYIHRPGEKLHDYWHRQGRLNRSRFIHTSRITWENKCNVCSFEDDMVGFLLLETFEGKVLAHLCVKCARRIIDRLEALIERHFKEPK
jgi:hypothetical protein